MKIHLWLHDSSFNFVKLDAFAMFPIFVNLNFVTLGGLVLVPKFTFFLQFCVKFDSWYQFYDISHFC